jgi:hypothetical protein
MSNPNLGHGSYSSKHELIQLKIMAESVRKGLLALELTIDGLMVGVNMHIYVPPITFWKKTNIPKEVIAIISLNQFAMLHHLPVQGTPSEWASDPDNISRSNANSNFIF